MDLIEEYVERKRADPRATADLIAGLPGMFAERTDGDNDPYWEVVAILHTRADDEVMSGMRKFAQSSSGAERAIAADVLAQVRVGNPEMERLAGDILMEMSAREENVEVLESLGYAWGHFYSDGRAVPFLEQLSRRPESDLRLAAAYSLPIAGTGEPEKVVPTLIRLSTDLDQDVRNWATFGLGSSTEVDSPEIRNALAERLNDSFDDARGEALVGLAIRGDERVVDAFFRELSSVEGSVGKHDLLRDAREEILKVAARSENSVWKEAARRIELSKKFDVD